MTYSKERQPYEFDKETKLAALLLHAYLCAICHEPERPHDRFQFNHEIPIWYAKEVGGALPIVLIKSLANCQPVHESCHKKYHLTESRQRYRELAPKLLARFLAMTAEEQDERDAWRTKLKGNHGHD